MNAPTDINIIAPQSIVDFVLKRRVPVFTDQNPKLTLKFNPNLRMQTSPTLYLQFSPDEDKTMLRREIGAVTVNVYRHKVSNALTVLPDIVGNLDANLVSNYPYHSPKQHSLWLSVHPATAHAPGIRQALDWTEGCIHSLTWLNDTNWRQHPLSQPMRLR